MDVAGNIVILVAFGLLWCTLFLFCVGGKRLLPACCLGEDEENEDLARFREQRNLNRASRQTEAHKELVKRRLCHRTLEHGESVRTLSVLLAAANDEGNNVPARTWHSASVRTLANRPKPECCICLDQYKAGETVCWAVTEDCNHIFHHDCILQWLADHEECPLCRTNILQDDQGQLENIEVGLNGVPQIQDDR